MRTRLKLTLGMSLLLLLTNSVPTLAQAKRDDISAILNLVRRGYGPVETVAVVDNYAILAYRLGQNSSRVTFKRQNNRWRIFVDGSPFSIYCGDVDCLVKKGVPRQTAIQLTHQLGVLSTKERKDLDSYQEAWSKIHSNAIPFLGYFDNLAYPEGSSVLTVSILPSYTRDKVCVVGTSETQQYVEVGKVKHRIINTANDVITLEKVLSTEYDTFISKKRKLDLAISVPPRDWYFTAETKKKLKQAGCTTSLPRR